MKKFLKVFLFALMLVSGVIFVSCGKKELTGLHKEFDIIFNGIKEEVTTEFKNNMTSLEEEIKNSSQNELEEKLQLFGIEVIYEALNTTEDRSNLLDEIQGLVKKVKKGKAPVIEQEMDIEMVKENDTWTISERQKHVLMKRMMGIEKGTIFDN